MTSDIRQTVEDIFQTVCELSPADRAAYLDQACSGDEALRREIEELLKFHESHETFLEKPALQDAARQMANHLAASSDQDEIPSDTLREGDWMFGPYRMLDQLGKGGMGVVYLAEDTRDGKRVAIKVLPKDIDIDEDRLARFNREGRMLEELKSLKHPNIAEIYEQAEYDGKPCIVLEYVPGDTLADRLRNGPLPIPEALQVALQIADALQSAHQRHIVHRDLKPANIKITPEGQVKVLDFGLAKRFQADLADAETGELRTRSMSLTESGMLIGTPAYMSPEQWNGQQIDQRTDLWAFGCVLYEMLAGRPPFAGKTRAETMKAVLDATPNWQSLPSGTPIIIQNLLLRCFQRDANQRTQNAKDARRAIAEAITENRFALLLYLKTWFWKIDRRIKIAFIATALALVVILALKYTSLGDLVFPAKKNIAITGKDDLAAILTGAIKGMTSELAHAALMPDRSSSDDLLQSEQWKVLMNKPESRQAIDDVITALKSRIEKNGASAQLYAVLAQAYLFKLYLTKDAKDKNDAVQAVQMAQSFNAEMPETLIAQGNVLIALERHKEAIEALEAAQKQLPDNPDVLLGLAIARDLSGDSENLAEGLYKAAIEARNNKGREGFWMDYDDFGWYYFDRGEYQSAADTWREIINTNPFSPTGYVNLGNAFLYLGCFENAERRYRESIASGGETIDARINLGAAYFYLGEYERSIGELKVVTDIAGANEDVNLIEAWGNLGDSYRQKGLAVDAESAYSVALKLIDKHRMQYRGDYQRIALKAEIIAKLKSLGQSAATDDPVAMIEQTLDRKLNCLECAASAVTIYHLAKRDDEASRMAMRAVDEGYSPFLLINNPDLAGLGNRVEFRRIQQDAQSARGKCEDK
ncbi:MAG: protein kinase [Blastocatellales bacterium]